jgi:hypothetical protein
MKALMKSYSIWAILAVSTLLLVPGANSVYSQNPANRSAFWSKVRYGGGIGLGFGNNSFNAQLAPSAIYQANPYFATGLGLNFNYAKFGDAKFTAYGGSVLSLFNPIPQIQLSAEFEELRVQRNFGDGLPDAEESYWLPALFAGIGYGNGNVTIGIRYDLLYDEDKSIYSNAWMPFVRVYF